MRQFLGFNAACLVLAVVAHAGTRESLVTLDPLANPAHPAFTVLGESEGSLRLEMRVSALGREELPIDGEMFQALTIPGGDIRGETGQPGLPVITRLVAVPSDVGVTVRVVNEEREVLSGYRLLPVQPDEATEFVIDRASYARRPEPGVSVVETGGPALMHSLRVVPLTFAPVAYDPVSGEVTVSTRVEVEVEFGGEDLRNAAPLQRSRIPESFHRMYQDVVLNYDSFMERGQAEVGPSTYLVIYSSASGVLAQLQPLLDWRTRQGYTVLTASTTQTGTSVTSIKNYIQNIYNTADPPLEFVTLVGDAADIPCWYESYSGYGGGGDHTYTTLEGSDYLADVHIGRLSYSDLTNLGAIVTKITTYETAPPSADAGWFTRACLLGDPSSSGISCIYINQWLKTQLLRAGYTQIDTFWASSLAGSMTSSANQGLTVLAYRGWLGMSGITTTTISALTNSNELPFAVIPTCDTGTFYSGTSRSEAFLRNANGGAIGSVGTATTGTHTRYNNSYFAGTWEGAINGSDRRLGTAHSRGKLNVYLNYMYDSNMSGHVPEVWSVWNSLMGDPATDMWTGYPATMTVTYPALLPVGANSLPVTVTVSSVPVSGALVTVHKGSELHVSGYTDFAGRVHLPISGFTAGTALVTVTKHNHIPHLGQTTFGSVGSYAVYAGSTVDDDGTGGSAGNGNGIVNPAETIELPVSLHNYGTAAAVNVTATLSTSDPYVSITDAEETYGTIGAGATVWSAEDFDFVVDPSAPDGHVLALDLTAHSGATDWASLIELTVQSAAFTATGFTWGGGAAPGPGDSRTLSIGIQNGGSIAGTTVTGELSTDSPWVDVTDAAGSWGTIAVGAAVQNTANPFALTVAGDCIKGHTAQFTLALSFNGQAQDVVTFTYTVGSATTTDPTGPDNHGYYAFDNTDAGYFHVPTYAWVELDPNYGGSGTDVGLSDFGYEQDDTEIKPLPFTFRFYGQDYTEISICSNGWVAMGRSYLKPYTNTTLPGPGAPEAAICAMWDDLYQSGTNRVYYWNDTANHRYGVQWSRVKNDYSNATQNFEMFLYDPAYYPTSTGDGEILLQYQTVNNTDSRDGYVTVGIQNGDHTDGLLYTYWNQYTTGSATLGTGRAIRILPIGSLTLGTLEGDVTNASGGTPVEGVTIRVLENNQTMGSNSGGHYTGYVQAGTYTVRAEHPSFELETVTNVVIEEGETTELDFSLTDVLGPQIANTTVLPTTDNTAGPYVVETTITDYTSVAGADLLYKVNGGGAVEVPLVLINAPTGLYRGEIPGQPLNTAVSYWIEASDGAANASRDPSGVGTYDFWVLQSTEILHHDMESEQGWTVGDTGDNATAGIWVRVDPNGVWYNSVEVQPENDATADPGVMCYITGNDPVGSNQGALDVDNGTTTVLSPWLDLSAYSGVQLSYRRWYTNDTGSSPGLDSWVVQVTDDGSTWVDLERTTLSDRSWALKTFVLDGYIDLSSTVRLRFVASDISPGSVVEAGLDEVSLTGYVPAMTLSGGVAEDQIELTWTAVPGAANYWVHGADNDAYFTPELGNRLAVVPGGTTTWSTTTGIGDPAHNWTYLVRAVDASELGDHVLRPVRGVRIEPSLSAADTVERVPPAPPGTFRDGGSCSVMTERYGHDETCPSSTAGRLCRGHDETCPSSTARRLCADTMERVPPTPPSDNATDTMKRVPPTPPGTFRDGGSCSVMTEGDNATDTMRCVPPAKRSAFPRPAPIRA